MIISRTMRSSMTSPFTWNWCIWLKTTPQNVRYTVCGKDVFPDQSQLDPINKMHKYASDLDVRVILGCEWDSVLTFGSISGVRSQALVFKPLECAHTARGKKPRGPNHHACLTLPPCGPSQTEEENAKIDQNVHIKNDVCRSNLKACLQQERQLSREL